MAPSNVSISGYRGAGASGQRIQMGGGARSAGNFNLGRGANTGGSMSGVRNASYTRGSQQGVAGRQARPSNQPPISTATHASPVKGGRPNVNQGSRQTPRIDQNRRRDGQQDARRKDNRNFGDHQIQNAAHHQGSNRIFDSSEFVGRQIGNFGICEEIGPQGCRFGSTWYPFEALGYPGYVYNAGYIYNPAYIAEDCECDGSGDFCTYNGVRYAIDYQNYGYPCIIFNNRPIDVRRANGFHNEFIAKHGGHLVARNGRDEHRLSRDVRRSERGFEARGKGTGQFGGHFGGQVARAGGGFQHAIFHPGGKGGFSGKSRQVA